MSLPPSGQHASRVLPLVRWAQTLPQGELLFELHSRDAEVLTRAEQIFSPYQAQAYRSANPFRSFRIELQRANGGASNWLLHSSRQQAEPELSEPQICETLASALANVEFAAVHAAAEYATVAAHAQLEARERVVGLHGALLHRNGKGVLIVGVHEAGKSTLACGLWQAGWSLLSDDYALLAADATTARGPLADLPQAAANTASARPVAHAISRRVSLRPTSRALVG